ncbi:MAG: FprA family A-type flavoprotein [Breznakia sp.]
MDVLEIKKNLYWVGVKDRDLRVFDIIMETKYGTTYNAYILKTEEGIILFEGVKEAFFDEYIKKINEIGSVDEIKYIVVSHTEPDHSGAIAKLLAINPHIVVVSSLAASRNLKEIMNHEFNSLIVKDGDTLCLGKRTLQFVNAINLHWPDTIYTYIHEDKVLVTCDSFGQHYASDHMLLSQLEDRSIFRETLDYYTLMIMGPFRSFVLKAMDKIKDFDIDIIAPGHGVIIDTDIQEMIAYYIRFATCKEKPQKSASIVYVSAYGYTKKMAEIIQDEFLQAGVLCKTYDLQISNVSEVKEALITSDVNLYGSPTMVADALPPIFDIMNAVTLPYHEAKIVSAFGSYGWSGEAVPHMIARLKQQKMKVVDEGLRILFKPSEAQIEQIRSYAKNIIAQM